MLFLLHLYMQKPPFIKEKAMIFIDARNIIKGEKTHNQENAGHSKFGYKELMNFFNNRFNVIRGYYYDGAPHKSQRSSARESLYNFMRRCGITLRLKEINFDKPNPSQKGVDIYLTSDMISLAYENAYDTAIICSGDGDYCSLVELVKSKGKKVWILCFECSLAHGLRECADKVLFIEKIPELQRREEEKNGKKKEEKETFK